MKRKHRYCIYKFNDELTEISVEKLGGRDETWDDFKNSVPKDQGRYLVYDLEFQESDGRKVSKVCLFSYSPDSNTNNQEKFVIANQLGNLKSKCNGANYEHQVNCWEDLDHDALVAKLAK